MRVVTLKRRADFLRVRGGARYSSGTLVLETRRRPDEGPVAENEARFGFTITKKIGGAVLRNRIRRRFKEALRRLPSAAALPGHDYVLIARGDAARCNFDALARDVAVALGSVNKAIQRDARRRGQEVGCDQGVSAGARRRQAVAGHERDQGSAAVRKKT
jgi:ribonuclease P protein component